MIMLNSYKINLKELKHERIKKTTTNKHFPYLIYCSFENKQFLKQIKIITRCLIHVTT